MTMAPQHPHAPPDERRDPWRVQRPQPPDRSSGPAADADRPRLAEGVELLGEYEGSGYVEQHYLARRPNGAVVQLTPLLHAVAGAADGTKDLSQVAEQVSAADGRTLTADNVAQLVAKLRPLGVLADEHGASPKVEPLDPLLALKFRTDLVGERAVRAMTTVFRPLFFPPLVVVTVLGLIAVDGWLFFGHGLAQPVRGTMNHPVVFLLAAGLFVLSAAFHECGHAAACAYSGARPGRMGAGLYLAWPAFYTDVTDAYRLSRGGRLRTDLGGIYFNALFVIGLVAAYAGTHFEPLLLVAFLLQIEIVHQMLPFLRLDGYYVVADLVGVPDLFRRVGPVLRSALPWRSASPEVTELKRWVRGVITVWVLVVLPILLANLLLIVVAAPRILATAWDSGAHLAGQMPAASTAAAVADGAQLLLLALPVLGLVLSFGRLGGRSLSGAWRWAGDSVPRRGLVTLGTAALLVLLALAWWPDQRLAPYRPGERGTLAAQVAALGSAGQGSPQLRTPSQAQQPLPASGTAPAPAATPLPVQPGPSAQPGSAAPAPAASTQPTAAPSAAPSAAAPGTPAPAQTGPATSAPTAAPTATP